MSVASRCLLPVLRHALGSPTAAGLTDAELLERYSCKQDEAAFEFLVLRYATLVQRACNEVVRDRHDAEDAFQATFLILARKSAAIRGHESLAAWLYRVALRVALRVQAGLRRRRAASVDLDGLPLPPDVQGIDPELSRFVHEEVQRLPVKYRTPIILCYFQGRTHEQAARELNWPIGTVAGRLSRARDLLRRRLTRRGVGITTITLTAVLSSHVAAAVPTRLILCTLHAARLFASGQAAGVVSPHLISLTEGVLRIMFLSKIKTVAAMLLVAFGLLAGGLGWWATQLRAEELREVRAAAVATANAALAPAQVVEEAVRETEEADDDLTIKNAPPVVVRTVPESGATDVNASVNELRVTYSKDMTDQSWSWSTASANTSPKTTGKPRYANDKRTAILPVKLEPGKTYAIWLNSERFQNFKDADGNPAVPYLLIFQTKK